jgi:hypothetical protein
MKTAIVFALFAAGLAGVARQKPAAPKPKAAEHHRQVEHRGDRVMGFSHLEATHHFRLFTDGGEIEVKANDPRDTSTRDRIRLHLRHIAEMFAAGDFRDPMQIHATTPPGVPAMKKLRTRIRYRYREIERGALVRISTRDRRAIEAVHAFLRFQIADHQTGDSTRVTRERSGRSH